MTAFLRIRELWKSFGSFVALRDISLDVNEGEFLCFLGPSGCGKTTLLRAIAGLDIQTSGSVHQAGRDISSLPPAERDFGIVFQSYALFPNLTIARNIAFGLENTGVEKSEINKRVAELLELMGLPEQANKYPAQLSGGQQQRIALARAIAMSPGLLLLDEPLSALDAKVRVHLRHEMKDLQRKLKVTTIMVTHDQEEALSMADQIVVMNHGSIEQVGTPNEVYTRPVSLFVAGFIGEMNQMSAKVGGKNRVVIGDLEFACNTGGLDQGSDAIVVIRPEDVFPVEPDSGKATPENSLKVHIDAMEFLGSFWRTHLTTTKLGGQNLIADFSVNAVQRLKMQEGNDLMVEMKKSNLIAFDAKSGAIA